MPKNITEQIVTGGDIRSVMRKLESLGSRIVFVVDDKKRLRGSVSDGDIRRALLNEANMDDDLISIMNKNPIYYEEKSSCNEIKKKILECNIIAVPIVDAKLTVVDIVTLEDMIKPQKMHNPVLIMAGGFGERLKPITDNCPKPMLPVGDKPLLEHIIENFINQGFYNFYISTHYLSEKIKNYFGNGNNFGDIQINYIHEESPLGTGGALSLLPKLTNGKSLLVINGDVLTNMNFVKYVKFHEDSDAFVTMCLRTLENQISYGVVNVQDSLVISIEEKPLNRYKVNTGIYLIRTEGLKKSTKLERIDMTDKITRFLNENKIINAYESKDYWLDIGSTADYQEAQKIIDTLY